MATISARTCEIMQYMEYMTEKNIKEIAENIEKLTQIKTYCIILHDKDTNEDGTLKKPHFHTVITLKSQMTFDSIAKTINVPVNYVNKIYSTTRKAQEYLIHLNNPEKHQYEIDDVISNFDYKKFIDNGKEQCSLKELAEKIENGEVKPYNVHKYIGIEAYSKYENRINRMFKYRQKKLNNGARNMNCIFITGPAGTGKTAYAKFLSQSLGMQYYVSAGGKNPLDDYEGQECIILDDTRDSTFSMTDFLKLTDNNTDSLVGCRYYNKSISDCKLLIVTSVKTLELFYEEAIKKDMEPKQQLYRRFKVLIKLTKEIMAIYEYSDEDQKYYVKQIGENPLPNIIPKEENHIADDIINATGIKPIKSDRIGKAMLEEIKDDEKIPF